MLPADSPYRRRVRVGALLALAVLAGCGHAGSTSDPEARRQVAAEAAAYPRELIQARRLGLPTTLAAPAGPIPPAGENAALVWARLGHLLRAYPLSARELALEGLSTEPMPAAKSIVAARLALAHRARYLFLVHKASSLPVCVFAHPWTPGDPAQIRFPEMDTMREAAMLLAGQSVLMAEDGHYALAVSNESAGFRIADQAAAENVLVAYQVAGDVDEITFTALEKIMYLSHGDPAVAKAVNAAVAGGWHAYSLAAALARENVFQQAAIAILRTDGPAGDGMLADRMAALGLGRQRAGSAAWNELLDANAAVLLHETTTAVAAANLAYPVANERLRAIDARSLTADPTHMLAAELLPDLASFERLRARVKARAQIVQAGAALLEWRGAHAAFPASPSAVLPALPLDPFSGKPLHYRRVGQGFVIYSVGPSCHFDGGTLTDEPPADESLFRWPLPPYDFPAKPTPPVSA